MCDLKTVQVSQHLRSCIPWHTYHLAQVPVLASEMLYPSLQRITLL